MNIDGLENADGCLGNKDIKKVIPYDEPFLFLDKVTLLEKSRIVAVKDVKADEDFFRGHFVDFPIMPGVLIIEGMGQAASLLVRNNMDGHNMKYVLAHKIKEAKFIAPVFPGMQLIYEVELLASDTKAAVLKGKAYSSGKTVAEALFMMAVVEKLEFKLKHGFLV